MIADQLWDKTKFVPFPLFFIRRDPDVDRLSTDQSELFDVTICQRISVFFT